MDKMQEKLAAAQSKMMILIRIKQFHLEELQRLENETSRIFEEIARLMEKPINES